MADRLLGIQLDADGAHAVAVDPLSGEASPADYVPWDGVPGRDPVAAFRAHPAVVSAPGHTVVALPEEAVHNRYLEFPPMRAEALETAVRSMVLRYFPFQSEGSNLVKVECPPLSGDHKRKGILAFLLDRAEVQRQTETMQALGRKLDHLEPGALALARWMLWEDKDLGKGTHLFVSLQRREVVVGLLSAKIVYGSFRLRPPVLSLPEWQAGEALQGLEPYAEALAARVEAAAAFFRYRLVPREIAPDSVVVVGRRASDPVLLGALRKRLGTTVRALEPQRLRLPAVNGSAPADYQVAAGLSLRNVEV